MKSPNTAFKYIYNACIVLFFLLSAGSGAPFEYQSANGLITVRLPHYVCIFTKEGNLQTVTAKYTTKKTIECNFKTDNSSPLITIYRSHEPDMYTIVTEHESRESLYNIQFISPSSQITWKFHENRYSFSFHFKGDTSLDSIRIHGPGISKIDKKPFFPIGISGGKVFSHSKITKKYLTQKTRFDITGFRNHFWAFLFRCDDLSSLLSFNKKQLTYALPTTRNSSITFYAGPITWNDLRRFHRESTHLLYPVWCVIRYLSIALLFLFNALLTHTHHTVIAIILLSLCVKLLIAPLYRIAARWQKEVNRQRSLLAPRLSEINKRFKGEEQTKKTLALYKELGIHPLYTLKSLLSAAIQIPVFFAAYHMLSEHIALSGVSICMIHDLAQPDQLLSLPIHIPLFGDHVNLLPFVMTGISISSACMHTDPSLSEFLHKKQRNSLFIMAALFLILLYRSPAGMLIYWTMNNIFSFFETFVTSFLQPKLPTIFIRNRPID